MSLQRIHFQTYNRPALHVVDRRGLGSERLDYSPAYQRGSVWTPEQREALIQSLLQGLPIGAVFLNLRGGDVMQPQRVVDGKQRLETLRMWIDDQFDVPLEWFADEDLADSAGGPRACWTDLSVRGQRRCQNDWTLATYETRLADEAGERELYERINYGGTPHEALV